MVALAEQLKWSQAGELSEEDRHVGELVVNDGRKVGEDFPGEMHPLDRDSD